MWQRAGKVDMPLSCGIGSDYSDCDCAWFGDLPTDYSIYPPTRTRGMRCFSCKDTMIRAGDICGEVNRRSPCEDEIPWASYFYCEKCTDICFNLLALGFDDLDITDNMQEAFSDYLAIYNPPKLSDDKVRVPKIYNPPTENIDPDRKNYRKNCRNCQYDYARAGGNMCEGCIAMIRAKILEHQAAAVHECR